MNNPNEYDVKLAATQLILDNIDNTFVTPVFNGSSLVRSASGYMIEAVFNKKYQTISGIKELYDIVNQRYNLQSYVK